MPLETQDQKIFGELRIFSSDSKKRIRTDDVYVYLVDMPVNEAVRPCGPFSYTVYINARLSQDGRVRAYRHALEHIRREDFEKEGNADTIEMEAHDADR